MATNEQRSSEAGGVSLRSSIVMSMCVMVVAAVVLTAGPLFARSSSGVKVPAGTNRVNVSLFEFGIKIDPSTPVRPGKNAFVITDNGKIPHELVGFATTSRATAMPTRTDGDVNEDSPQLKSVLDTGAALKPGQTRVIVTTLDAGTHYAFVCNLPGHWRLGMRVDVTP